MEVVCPVLFSRTKAIRHVAYFYKRSSKYCITENMAVCLKVPLPISFVFREMGGRGLLTKFPCTHSLRICMHTVASQRGGVAAAPSVLRLLHAYEQMSLGNRLHSVKSRINTKLPPAVASFRRRRTKPSRATRLAKRKSMVKCFLLNGLPSSVSVA